MQVSGNTKPQTRLQSTGGSQQTSYATVRLVTFQYNPNPNPNFVRINVLRHSSQRTKLLGSTPLLRPVRVCPAFSSPSPTRTYSYEHSLVCQLARKETRHPRALVRTRWEQQSFRQPQSLNHDGPAYHLTNNPHLRRTETRGRKIKTRREEKNLAWPANGCNSGMPAERQMAQLPAR